jgi:hypothetical protein
MDIVALIKDYATPVVAAGGASIALLTYWKNTNTRRAEFLWNLHKSFFVDDTYKTVRRVFDDPSEEAATKRATFAKEEPEEFTDFLNFFELVAYLERRRNLSRRDIEALFDYYLTLLEKDQLIRNYIRNPKNGFEQLDGLLAKLHTRTGVVR